MKDLAGRAVISVPEAGRLFGLGRSSAYGAAQRGEIPTMRLGRRLVVPVPRLLVLIGYGVCDPPAPWHSSRDAEPPQALPAAAFGVEQVGIASTEPIR